LRKILSQEEKKFLSIIKPYRDYNSVIAEDTPSYIKDLWCVFRIMAAKEDCEGFTYIPPDFEKVKVLYCSLKNISFEEFDNLFNKLTYEEAEKIFKEKTREIEQIKRCERFYSYFAPHSDWYEYVDVMGYIPTPICPLRAVLTMLEYDSYYFGKEHIQFTSRKISEKVKLLIENDYPKKETVMTALGENGFDKIDEMVELEKEIQRLKEESDKLTDWPECNES